MIIYLVICPFENFGITCQVIATLGVVQCVCIFQGSV